MATFALQGGKVDDIVIREATAGDLVAIKNLAVANHMFDVEEVSFFDEMFAGFLDDSAPDDLWIVADRSQQVLGAAYLAPEPFGERVWNLYFIATDEESHGSGIGSALLSRVERHLHDLGPERALVLIVETSATDPYAGARAFYERRGFDRESTIRDYYGLGDAKVTYWKPVNR